MNGIFSYLKSYVILFLVLTILLEMVPKAGMQKYIHFFSQMILVFGLLYPVLGWMGENRISVFFTENGGGPVRCRKNHLSGQ